MKTQLISPTPIGMGGSRPCGLHSRSLPALLASTLLLLACNKGGESGPTGPGKGFPVNEAFATELAAKGLPVDIARFIAAVKFESSCPDDTTCIYKQTFLTGATREMTLRVVPGRQYTPTTEEMAQVTPGAPAIYGFKYASETGADSSLQIDMDYYIPKEGLPKPSAGKAAAKAAVAGGAADRGASEGGAGIAWGEIGKTGADVAIGSIIDAAKDKGVKVGNLGNIYALASAASALGGAADLSKQNSDWLAELEALEKCAANPTNPIAKSDPKYSSETVARIRNTRSELKEVNAVRFLNQMTETGAGITPVTAVMSVGLKQGFVWSEQTLKDYSEKTLMREARLAVVKCEDPGDLKGNVTVTRECTSRLGDQVDTELGTIVSQVGWTFDPASRMYVANGSYDYQLTKTATLGGKSCVYKESFKGNIVGAGRMMIIDDPAMQNLLGYGYSAGGFSEAEVNWTESCRGTAGTGPVTVTWLPDIQGFPGTGGAVSGTRTRPVCIGDGSSGTETTEFEFAIPPKE